MLDAFALALKNMLMQYYNSFYMQFSTDIYCTDYNQGQNIPEL